MEKLEFEWKWMYNPLEWNMFIVDENNNEVVYIKRRRMPKDRVYESKEAYLDYLKK